jgi:hypothetical protein
MAIVGVRLNEMWLQNFDGEQGYRTGEDYLGRLVHLFHP